MFRPMRRLEKQMTDSETFTLLEKSEYGILSVHGEDGFPYGVPVNHILKDHKIYFHCAMSGHKLSALASDPRSCYTIIGSAEVKPETFETYYESAIAFGTTRLLHEGEEKTQALHAFIDRFSSAFKASGLHYVEENAARTMVIAFDISHITGKRGR